MSYEVCDRFIVIAVESYAYEVHDDGGDVEGFVGGDTVEGGDEVKLTAAVSFLFVEW